MPVAIGSLMIVPIVSKICDLCLHSQVKNPLQLLLNIGRLKTKFFFLFTYQIYIYLCVKAQKVYFFKVIY